MPLAASSSSCSSLRAAFVAMSQLRVFADFLLSLPHRSQSGHLQRLYCPVPLSLDFDICSNAVSKTNVRSTK